MKARSVSLRAIPRRVGNFSKTDLTISSEVLACQEMVSFDPVRALENTRISLSNGMADITVKAPRAEFPKILNELSEMSAGLEEFLHILPLTNLTKIIIPTEDYELIKKKLRHLNVVTVQPNVAKLSLYLSTSAGTLLE